MNAHLPQSYEAMVELEEIAAVPHHIITARHGKPLIGVYQDTLVGSYRLTQPGIEFTRREFMNLMMWNKRFDGTMPVSRAGAEGKQRWTGQQVLGALMPPINMEMGNKSYDGEKDNNTSNNYVKIVQGDIQQGVVDGDIYMKPSKGIIHVAYNDCGPKDTVELLDALQNTIENFLVLNGFSVGISDLIADEETKKEIDRKIQEKKKQVEQVILQVHLDLFDNNTGKTNQQEFEDQIFGILNQATSDAGSTGQQSLSAENRLLAMVRSGSKGEPLNVAQMMACLGQTAIEGKRVPYGFTDRTLPHYKKYDDSSEARGFIESSFIRGLTPQQFFFHAMSGREGLIDTAVKSVTADTEIMIMEDGQTKWTKIGVWIDKHLDNAMPEEVEHHEQANMELLKLTNKVYIPTCTEKGIMTWGELTAITRHDPGECLYEVTTKGGRRVMIAKSQSLIVWDQEKEAFLPKPSPEVKAGDYLPTTVQLPEPPIIITHVEMMKYAKKLKGPNYSLPEQLELNERNGLFFGLYLAEGNSHLQSGYVSIANNDQTIRTFAMEWFESLGINANERFRAMENKTRTGVTKSQSHGVRGYSRLLGQFFETFLGAGSANKYVPDEAFGASKEFIRGLLNGYFSGDGTVDVKKGSITAGSASKRLIEGISLLCSRFGIFGKMSTVQLKSNNVMTPVEKILPTYRFAICAKWATKFAAEIPLISKDKQDRVNQIKHTHEHRNFTSINDVARDEIVSIAPLSVEAHPKLYDVTVPSTLNFMIANGLVCRDTADTGYIQRQLIKSMEDLTVQHDGTVRDANNNVIQFHYGEDGIDPTKIETQSLPIGKLSKQDIEDQFGMKQVDWSTVLKDGTIRDADAELITEYVNDLLFDQRMMVEEVFQKKSLDSGSVFAPVNLARWVLNIKVRCALKPTEKTDLTPAIVLNGIKKIIERTHSYHKIWAALLRFHLAPHKLIVKERFTKEAFELLMEIIVITHMKSWVQPGDQVGIVAAQSIGEPATQMTLNSVDWDTEIIITKNGKIITPKIGEFIDQYYDECVEDADKHKKIQYLPNGQIYIPLEDGNEWKAISCDEDGNIKWTKLEAITRHPVINEDGTNTILKVILESGREVKATKGKSFLTLQDGKILATNGSDLNVGDALPIANHLKMEQLELISDVSLRSILPPTDYLYGAEVQKAMEVMKTTTTRHWFQTNQGTLFTVPYSRSDSFREAFEKGHNSNDIRSGNVYNKHMKKDVSQIPETIPLTQPFGFFCGAYLAEGMSNDTQVMIANNDQGYLNQISSLMDSWNVGTHVVTTRKTIEKSGITGLSTTLVIHSTILAKVLKTWFGRVSYEKQVPNWALQAPDAFLKGLVDGYISGDGTVDKRQGTIHATSVSFDLLLGIQLILARYEIYSKMTTNMPSIGKFYSVSRNYTITLPAKYSTLFAKVFTLSVSEKQLRLDYHHSNRQIADVKSKWNTMNDVVWDKIKSIEEVLPMGDGWVYDLTVDETKNFTTKNLILQRDTFHQAGVASKSAVTRGVPRLRELLKVTQNPKASSLTIYLKPEYRNNKDKAREVVQDLELTVLRNITDKVGIYWDEKDSTTIVKEDVALMKFYALFEQDLMSSEEIKDVWSKWILRLELNREEMFNRNISIQEVVSVIKTQFNDDINIVYSDYNSDKLVMRIRLSDKKDKDTASQLDDFTNLKKFQNKLLNNIVIRGLPGIKAVTFRNDKQYVENIDGKYEQVEQFVLDTDGSNFIKVMNHPAVDGTKLYSTNVWDVYEVLGIEATRAILFNEIHGLFESVGVNYRHLCLLCDVITRFGRLMSIDRYGINKNDIGTLAKASFEETEKILLKAALFGEVDPVTGVSANIMMGQPIRGGTAFSQILMDDQMLPQLLVAIDVEKNKLDAEEEGDLSKLEEEGMSLTDPCSTHQFKLNMVLPQPKVSFEEPDIEFDII